jgi:hypothetical protein
MNEDLAFLEAMTRDVVDASRVRPGEHAGATRVSSLPFTVVRPGGGELYPALWTRDFAMSVESGFMSTEEITNAVQLLAATQAESDVALPSGAFIPRGSIADHVNLDGVPIFYPGTYEPRDQGGHWGVLPSLDDQFYFVFLLWYAARVGGAPDLPRRVVSGMSLLQRAELAFAMPPVAEASGLVTTTEERWGISFGFTDTVKHTGALLFASLLRCEAAGRLADLCLDAGIQDRAAAYAAKRRETAAAIAATFAPSGSGLLRASTGRSGQPDVWGTAYAVHRSLLPPGADGAARRALRDVLRSGLASYMGQIRHVPEDQDYDESRVWESPLHPIRKGTYQHGAYWATPLGWVLDAVGDLDRPLALGLLAEYVAHLRREDFRSHGGDGAPWECVHPTGTYRQNGVYMASVAAVLPAARRLVGYGGAGA